MAMMLIVKVPCLSPYRIPDIDLMVKRITDVYGFRLVGCGFGFGFRDNEVEVPTRHVARKLEDMKRAIARSFPGVEFDAYQEDQND